MGWSEGPLPHFGAFCQGMLGQNSFLPTKGFFVLNQQTVRHLVVSGGELCVKGGHPNALSFPFGVHFPTNQEGVPQRNLLALRTPNYTSKPFPLVFFLRDSPKSRFQRQRINPINHSLWFWESPKSGSFPTPELGKSFPPDRM